MSNLMAHKDTVRVEEDLVKMIEAPEFTDTWHPVSHAQVIESLQDAIDARGIRVLNKEYSINATGSRMFGVWNLDQGDSKMGYALGIRNSIDKSMVLGICAGTNVFVCDNMCFSGDFIQFRKHTGGLDLPELKEIGYNAIGGAVIEMEKMVNWQNGLHEYYVPEFDRKAMVYDMMKEDVFSPSNFTKYHEALAIEVATPTGRKLEGAHSLFAMHGAATRLMKDWNLLRVADATRKLNSLCDRYMASNTIH